MLTKKNLLSIVAVIIFLFLFYALWLITTTSYIEVVIPKRQHIRQFVFASGTIEPIKSYKVTSNIGGYIKKINVDINDQVTKDQILVQMKSNVSLKKLEQSKARLEHASKVYNSQSKLKNKRLASETSYSLSQSEYLQAKAEYEILLSNYEEQSIKSADDCQILEKYKEEGEYANPGEPILLCGYNSNIRVVAKVDENNIFMLHEGQMALIMPESNANSIYEAKVTKILPYADKIDNSYVIYIDLPKPVKLPLGLSVRANILARDNQQALVVPTSAILNSKVQILEGNLIQERRVLIGVKNYEIVEVLGGLSEQEIILLEFKNHLESDRMYKGKLVKF